MAFRILDHMGFTPDEIGVIVSAIGNHDEARACRSVRWRRRSFWRIKATCAAAVCAILRKKAFDIHDRVNYSVEKSLLKINREHSLIKLKLSVDTHYGSVMDYFEIFLERMVLCRKAAEKLGLQFKLMINEQSLI
mgnify:CR=1 FL=1